MSSPRLTKDYFTLATLFCLFVCISYYNWQDSNFWRIYELGKNSESRLDFASIKALVEHIHESYKPVVLPVSALEFYDKASGRSYLIEEQIWNESFGEDLCIVDINTKDHDQVEKLLGRASIVDAPFGSTNHFLYASIHGYAYHTLDFKPSGDEAEDNIWILVPQLRKLLDQCRFTLIMDADVIFQHLEIPIEWLLNRWNFTRDTSMAMPWDTAYHVDKRRPRDGEIPGTRKQKGLLNINAGIILAQSLPRTLEMVDDWIACADGAKSHTHACSPAQAGAANRVRYHFEKSTDLVTIPCDDANGYAEFEQDCAGTFIHRYTSRKEAERDAGQLLLDSLSSIFTGRQEDEKREYD